MLIKQELIESGLIEMYCLGHTSAEESQTVEEYATNYPEIQSEIDSIVFALSQYAQSFAPAFPISLKEQLWNRLQVPEIDISMPPLLGENSNLTQWKTAVRSIEIPEVEDNVYMHPIRTDEQVEMFLVKLREFIPDEHHEDILESFLILEGECECIVEGKTIKMKAGDHIQMPLFVVHNIRVISEKPVIAILEWLKAA